MRKYKSIYILTALIISILAVVIINGCGDDTTVTPVATATPTTPPVTPTNTPVQPTPTNTPTPTPGVTDVSDQFVLAADYYIDNSNLNPYKGTLYIQLYQKTTSTLSVKGFEIKADRNPDFPVSGAIPVPDQFNNPPADWTALADLTHLIWQGATELSKGKIYSFNTAYTYVPVMPKTVIISLAGGTAPVNTKDAAGAETFELGFAPVIITTHNVTSPTPAGSSFLQPR